MGHAFKVGAHWRYRGAANRRAAYLRPSDALVDERVDEFLGDERLQIVDPLADADEPHRRL